MKKNSIKSADLILAMHKAKQDDSKILNDLMDLFLDMDNTTHNDTIMVDNKIFDYINQVKINSIITFDSLALALARSIYEYNHEMKKKLTKYFRNYIDSLVNKEDIKVITDLIMDDSEVVDYINKYNSTDEYIKYLIQKRINKKEYQKKDTPKKNSKSYVIM